LFPTVANTQFLSAGVSSNNRDRQKNTVHAPVDEWSC
jgi:hypothetical protein